MGRPASSYRDYVTITKKKGDLIVEWQCNFCYRKFSSSASRIKPHLEGIERQGIAICEKIEAYKEYRLCNRIPDNNIPNTINPQEAVGLEYAEARMIETIQEENDPWLSQSGQPGARTTQRDDMGNLSLSIPSSSRFDNLSTSENQHLDRTVASLECLATGSAMPNNPLEADNETIGADDVDEPLPESQSLRKRRREAMDKSVSTGHAGIRRTLPCSATNLEGHGESPNIMDPLLPSSFPDAATSSHGQPQAGIAAGIVNPDSSENPKTTNTSRLDDHTQSVTYHNSGKQLIQGVTIQTGYVKGNSNGVINLGNLGAFAITQNQSNEADLKSKVDALIGLTKGMRDGRTKNAFATQPNSSSPSPLGGENHGLASFGNTGEHTMNSLTAQTGIIEGNFNGFVNFGRADI